MAAKALLSELLGLTTDSREYVYLSDGGHFENLGLYEMVRRRCRHIIVSDAGCDPQFGFEDLGNAVRKISLDLGVEITFNDLLNLRSRVTGETSQALGKGRKSATYAIGTIHYGAADGGGEDGTVLYIKPTFYSGDLKNAGVLNYGVSHPDFPHESTADQWFDEPQFESYRALGYEILDELLGPTDSTDTLASIFERLSKNPSTGMTTAVGHGELAYE